jgi:hypothetical protein
MTKARLLILLIVAAHWFVGIVHLFFAAQVLPAPNNHVSLLAVTFITLVHWAVALGLWKLTQKPVLWVSLIFFLAAMSADLYEHFLHASLNNIFMVAPGGWATWFEVSVIILLALEVLGCLLGILSLRGGKRAKVDSKSQITQSKESGLFFFAH